MKEVHRIVRLSHPRPGWSEVTFANGEIRQIEWSRFASEGPVFAHLADTTYAAKAKLIHHGHAVVWPDGMDWDAGAVYKDSKPVSPVRLEPIQFVRPLRASGKPLFEPQPTTKKVAAKQTKTDTAVGTQPKLKPAMHKAARPIQAKPTTGKPKATGSRVR